jgi:putative ABC transport system permease protein
LQDIRFGLRMLLKNPGFTCACVLTLALGIGATTAIYSVVNSELLNPLPGPAPERLVQIAERNYTYGLFREENRKPFFVGVSPALLEAVTANRELFSQLAWADAIAFERKTEDFVATEHGWLVSANFFELWHVAPLLGRAFDKDEAVRLNEQEKPVQDSVIVLAYSWWQTLLGGDVKAIGKTIELSGRHFTVIGVMPPEFQFPWGGTKFWVGAEQLRLPPGWGTAPNIRMFARLKPGVAIQQAEVMLNTVAQRLTQDPQLDRMYGSEWQRRPGGLGVWVRPARYEFTDGRGDLQRTLYGLLAAIGFVLLIVCTNVANLMLARIERRQQELAIRTALGAGRLRLMRQLLTESVALACLGGIGGLAIAAVGVRLLAKLVPEYLPRLKSFHIDGYALGATALISLATGLACGCIPAWHAGQGKLGEALKQAGANATVGLGRKRFRAALVSIEFALTLVLLAGAGLMIESVVRLLHVNPGFDVSNLVRVDLQLPWDRYNDPQHYDRATQLRAVLYGQLYDRLVGLPGVKAVGIGKHGAHPEKLKIPGQDQPMEVLLDGCGVGPSDVFRAMRIPLLRGRYFDQQDQGDGVGTTIINETMARMFWPGEDPLGKRFGGLMSYGGNRQYEVVGVVGDIRDSSYHQQLRPTFYRPCYELRLEGQAPFFVLRSDTDPHALLPAIRKELKAVESEMRVPRITLSQQALYDSTQAQRTYMLLLVAFAAAGLLLASIGIYGVLAYAVTRRTRELGIRMALGAQRRLILAMVLAEGGRLVAGGIVSGLIAAFWLTRLLKNQLFEVSPTDPVLFTGVLLILVAVALLACLVPAFRATQVDPMTALRYE